METFLGSLESNGGYAILAGAWAMFVFWLAKYVIDAATARNKEREAETIRCFDAQMERERADRETIGGMTDRMITALDGNTRVIATVTEVVRDTNGRLEAIDKHLSRNADGAARATHDNDDAGRDTRARGRL